MIDKELIIETVDNEDIRDHIANMMTDSETDYNEIYQHFLKKYPTLFDDIENYDHMINYFRNNLDSMLLNESIRYKLIIDIINDDKINSKNIDIIWSHHIKIYDNVKYNIFINIFKTKIYTILNRDESFDDKLGEFTKSIWEFLSLHRENNDIYEKILNIIYYGICDGIYPMKVQKKYIYKTCHNLIDERFIPKKSFFFTTDTTFENIMLTLLHQVYLTVDNKDNFYNYTCSVFTEFTRLSQITE